MPLYFVDDTEHTGSTDFNAALFVNAETPLSAARKWEGYFERGATVARVVMVPTPSDTKGAIDWESLEQITITL